MSHSPVKLALIGAGQRGQDVYGAYVRQHPDQATLVAVAEPIPERRIRVAEIHAIPAAHQFTTWEDLFDRPRLADAVIIANHDQGHTAPTLAALRAGYDVLLEKPMATTLEECAALVQTAESTGQCLQVCHVLRYTPFFSTLHDVIQAGRIGDVVTVEHRENVAYYHMAHSYVRGNWRRADQSSPMILAKCCHDLDILYWILGEQFTRLSSTGSLRHFRPENAPHPDVPPRCTDGCPVEPQCPFSAVGIYLENRPWGGDDTPRTWPQRALANGDLSREALETALREGPYGRCVYHTDNDVVDHQIVLMETEANTSVALIMHGHSHLEGRTMRYDGTRATLEGTFTQGNIRLLLHDHLTGQTEDIPIPESTSGHGGGDAGLMAAFLHSLQTGEQNVLTTAQASFESHRLAFAAEEARLNHTVVDLTTFATDH